MTRATTAKERLASLRSWPSLRRVIGGYVDRMSSLPHSERARFWLWRIAGRVLRPEIAGLLGGWDRAAASVLADADDFAALYDRFRRALPERVTTYHSEYDDQFRDAAVEMLGYHYFCDKSIGLHFAAEGPLSSPDMANGSIVVECKNFHTSQEERDYFRSEEVVARSVWGVFDVEQANPFLTKILKTVEEQVLPKLATYPPNEYRRYLFANFSLDTVALVVESDCAEGKLAFFESLRDVLRRERSIELVAIEKYALERRVA